MAHTRRDGSGYASAIGQRRLILLDTVAILWLVEGRVLKDEARKALRAADVQRIPLAVSAITAWEVCLLEKRGKTGLSIGGNGERWFYSAVRHFGLAVLPIDERVAIGSRRLPGKFHQDPGDCFVVATARIYDIPVVTSDSHILDYAALGHVRAIAC
jgi:PIN domain nuclease of toxin-antitoxin system